MFAHATTGWDNLIYDQLLRIHSRTPSDKILIVSIDDPSLAALGAWPWGRALHAKLLNRLTNAGVAGVAYDVLFVEPDPTGGDFAFSQALKASGRTVLPTLALSPGEDGRAVEITEPLQPLGSAAAALGQVNLITDGDGVARRYSEIQGWEGACWPQLTASLLAVAHQSVYGAADCAPLRIASRHVDALLASPPKLIPFAGPPGRFRTLSAVDVIKGEAPAELLKGRLVLVGATAAGLGDRHMTAGSAGQGAMPGVEIQANILDAALQGVRLVSLPAWIVALASLAPVSAFLASLLLVRPSANMLVGLCLLATVFVVSAALFLFGVWLTPLPAAAGLLLAYPLWSWRRLAAASDYLRDEISKFAPPAYASRPALPDDTLGRQVSALSRATDHLRDIMRLFEDALQSLPDATILIDQGDAITLANLRAAHLVGQDNPDALVGLSLGDWLSPAIGALEADVVMAALKSGKNSTEITSDQGVDFEVSQAPFANVSGDAGAILRLADITAVRSAMRQREEAIQFLTHDIRAPLSSIVSLVQTVEAKPNQGLTSRVGAYAQRALALAEGYVQFARAESYRFSPHSFDLSQVVLDAADELWPQARGKSITVDATSIEMDVWVNGDRSLVTRALINLLENAIKYSAENTTVILSLKVTQDQVICAVADQGPGMSNVDIAALFKSFQRGVMRQSSSTGVGLGLAFVHTVMQRHGGRVDCQSAPDGGCIFELRFPLALMKTDQL